MAFSNKRLFDYVRINNYIVERPSIYVSIGESGVWIRIIETAQFSVSTKSISIFRSLDARILK